MRQPDVGGRRAETYLVLATLTAMAVVPDWPHRHLDDPSYWGVIGFLVVVMGLLRGRSDDWAPKSARRRLVILLLVGLPLIFVADWARFGGTPLEFGVQAAGLLVWLTIAGLARTSDRALWLGCGGHALWDAAHFGRVDFVPSWYLTACVAADLGVATFLVVKLSRSAGPS